MTCVIRQYWCIGLYIKPVISIVNRKGVHRHVVNPLHIWGTKDISVGGWAQFRYPYDTCGAYFLTWLARCCFVWQRKLHWLQKWGSCFKGAWHLKCPIFFPLYLSSGTLCFCTAAGLPSVLFSYIFNRMYWVTGTIVMQIANLLFICKVSNHSELVYNRNTHSGKK